MNTYSLNSAHFGVLGFNSVSSVVQTINSLYTARALYSYIDHTLYFDDTELCESHGFYKTDVTQNKNNIVNENATLTYDVGGQVVLLRYNFKANTGGKLKIYTLLGQPITESNLPPNNELSVAALPDLATGVLNYIITSESGFMHTGKLIVVRK